MRNVLQGSKSHPVSLRWAHRPYSKPATGCLVWGFRGYKVRQTYICVFFSELFISFPERLVILETQKAAPLPKANFAPKGQWISGCQAAKGEMYNRKYLQYTIDKIHNQNMIAVTCHVLISAAFTGHIGRLHKQQGAALCIWKISALYRDKFTDATTRSETLLGAISCHP